MRRAIVLAVTVVSGLAAPRVAEACSCGDAGVLSPRDGATGVPTNALIVGDGDPPASAYSLREVGGAAVALEPLAPEASRWQAIVLRPTSPLMPGATYEVRIAPYRTPAATFTVGDGPDEAAPEPVAIEALSVVRYRTVAACGNSCWEREDGDDLVQIDHAGLADDVVLTVVEVRREEEAEASFVERATAYRFERERTRMAGGCGADAPVLEDGETYCLRIVAYDAAGNASAASVEACARASTCVMEDCPFDDEAHVCVPQDRFDEIQTGPDGCASARAAPGAFAGLLVFLVLAVRRRRALA